MLKPTPTRDPLDEHQSRGQVRVVGTLAQPWMLAERDPARVREIKVRTDRDNATHCARTPRLPRLRLGERVLQGHEPGVSAGCTALARREPNQAAVQQHVNYGDEPFITLRDYSALEMLASIGAGLRNGEGHSMGDEMPADPFSQPELRKTFHSKWPATLDFMSAMSVSEHRVRREEREPRLIVEDILSGVRRRCRAGVRC